MSGRIWGVCAVFLGKFEKRGGVYARECGLREEGDRTYHGALFGCCRNRQQFGRKRKEDVKVLVWFVSNSKILNAVTVSLLHTR